MAFIPYKKKQKLSVEKLLGTSIDPSEGNEGAMEPVMNKKPAMDAKRRAPKVGAKKKLKNGWY